MQNESAYWIDDHNEKSIYLSACWVLALRQSANMDFHVKDSVFRRIHKKVLQDMPDCSNDELPYYLSIYTNCGNDSPPADMLKYIASDCCDLLKRLNARQLYFLQNSISKMSVQSQYFKFIAEAIRGRIIGSFDLKCNCVKFICQSLNQQQCNAFALMTLGDLVRYR